MNKLIKLFSLFALSFVLAACGRKAEKAIMKLPDMEFEKPEPGMKFGVEDSSDHSLSNEPESDTINILWAPPPSVDITAVWIEIQELGPKTSICNMVNVTGTTWVCHFSARQGEPLSTSFPKWTNSKGETFSAGPDYLYDGSGRPRAPVALLYSPAVIR